MARRRAWLLLVSSMLWLNACESDGTDPAAPASPPSELKALALAIDVDLAAGSATVRPPEQLVQSGGGPSFALFGRNEVSAAVSNVTRSRISEFTPSRVRVRFDLSLTNKLLNSDLVPSTFPTAPVAQVVAFPFGTEPRPVRRQGQGQHRLERNPRGRQWRTLQLLQ